MHLLDKIPRSKALGKPQLRAYQPFCIGAQKWPILDRSVSVIRHVGEYGLFTVDCTKSPLPSQVDVCKRLSSTEICYEWGRRWIKREITNDHLPNRNRKQHTRQNKCKTYFMFHDSEVMVFWGVEATFADPDSLLCLLSHEKEATVLIGSKENTFHINILKLCQEWFWALRGLSDEQMR